MKLSDESTKMLTSYFKERDKAEPKGYTLSLILSDLKAAGIVGETEAIKNEDENVCSMKSYLELIATIVRRQEDWPSNELDIVRKAIKSR